MFLKNIIHLELFKLQYVNLRLRIIISHQTASYHPPARIEKQTQRSMQGQKHFTIGALRERNVKKKTREATNDFPGCHSKSQG